MVTVGSSECSFFFQVNLIDDRGVLKGYCSGDCTGGKEPSIWQGSMLILQECWKMPRNMSNTANV